MTEIKKKKINRKCSLKKTIDVMVSAKKSKHEATEKKEIGK